MRRVQSRPIALGRVATSARVPGRDSAVRAAWIRYQRHDLRAGRTARRRISSADHPPAVHAVRLQPRWQGAVRSPPVPTARCRPERIIVRNGEPDSRGGFAARPRVHVDVPDPAPATPGRLSRATLRPWPASSRCSTRAGDGTGHAPHRGPTCPIAMGGGVAGSRPPTARSRLRRHPDWIRARMPSGDNYHDLKGLLRGLIAQHGLRGGPLPEHRGVLGPAHRHDHDPRRHVHPGLRLLRRQDRPARPGSTTTSRAASPRRSAQLGLEHVVVTSVARDDLPDGGARVFAETIRAMRDDARPGWASRS